MNTRELDLTVLHLIFGVKRVYYNDWDTEKEFNPEYIPSGKPIKTHAIDLKLVPRFSTSPDACYVLKLKMAEKYHWEIKSPFFDGQRWFAGLTPHSTTGWNGEPDFKDYGSTEMEAVCRCALRASGFDPNVISLPQEISINKY